MTAQRDRMPIAAGEPIFDWWTPFGGEQHAWRTGGYLFRSICDRVRWTVRVERDREAPLCDDCRRIGREAGGAELQYGADAEAEAVDAAWDLKRRTMDAEQLADVTELERRASGGDR